MRNIYKQNQVNIIKNDDNVKKNNFVSPKIYPSFRTKNKQNYEENKSSNDSILNSNSFFLKDKKNHRSTREINQYLKEKKMKNKQIEDDFLDDDYNNEKDTDTDKNKNIKDDKTKK